MKKLPDYSRSEPVPVLLAVNGPHQSAMTAHCQDCRKYLDLGDPRFYVTLRTPGGVLIVELTFCPTCRVVLVEGLKSGTRQRGELGDVGE